MIKVKINYKDNFVNGFKISGHANYDEYGKDIVCASVSSIVITSINAALRIESNSLNYQEEKNKLTIEITSDNENVLLIIENMISMLQELALTYKKNIKIVEEE